MRNYMLLLLCVLSFPLPAAQTPIANSDFANSMVGWWLYPAQVTTGEIVPSTVPEHAKALRITLALRAGMNPWDAATGTTIASPLHKGDHLKLRLWMRSPQGCPVTVNVEMKDAPYTPSITAFTRLAPSWQVYQFEGAATQDFAADAAGISLQLAHQSGVVEITGVSLEDLGAAPLDQAPFPFIIPANVTSFGAADAADLNPAPLTDRQRLRVLGNHFVDVGGRRVRFVGVSVTAGSCFPPKDKAPIIAARLHHLGINCVRLHHMDSSWPVPNIFYFDSSTYGKPTLTISPQSLDRLDYFIAQLKAQGVYVDLNLHVGRNWSKEDGFPNAAGDDAMGKVTAYFLPRAITLQQQYARDLLTHVNPYTKLRYADDPVVAVIEMNNEDTLVGSVANLAALPTSQLQFLTTGWNAFLKARYGATSALLKAWNADSQPLGANMLANAQFANGMPGWIQERQGTTKYTVTAEQIPAAPGAPAGQAAHFSHLEGDGTNWHMQFHQISLDFQSGKRYTVSFFAMAPKARIVPVTVMNDEAPWNHFGPEVTAKLTPQWQHFSYTFIAQDTTPHHGRLSFVLGDDAGDFYLADLAVCPGGGAVNLGAGESLEAGTISLPAGGADLRGCDLVRYLMQVESAYTHTMQQTIRACGSHAPVVCSQASYGDMAGMWREAQMDYIDMHAYWQHPSFPNRAWDVNDYRVGNSSMIADKNGGTVIDLAMHRQVDKPFTVSEYNHPVPSEYAAETVPMIFTIAAWQDWDGVFLFDYGSDAQDFAGKRAITSFFDNAMNPDKLAYLPWAARLFLRDTIPQPPPRITLQVPTSSVPELTARKVGNRIWQQAGSPVGLPELLSRGLQVAFTEQGALQVLPAMGAKLTTSPLVWVPQRRLFTFSVPTSAVIAGQIGGQTVSIPDMRVAVAASVRDFAVISLSALDARPMAQSHHLLLTAIDKVENTGLVWNSTHTMAWNAWTQGPTQVWAVPATIHLRTTARTAEVYPLTGSGARGKPIPARIEGGEATFAISAADQTVWYEVVSQ